MEDNTLQRTMLLDFFGDLLTDKQREYFDLHYNEDLSLAEIAEQSGISRQGVWDIIRRAEGSLLEMEAKTGLVRRFTELQKTAAELENGLETLRGMTQGQARSLTEQLLAKVEELKG